MKFLRIAAILAMCTSMIACKKNATSPAQQEGITVKKALGTPTGNAIVKSIGPAGGTIQSADGRMTVTVPAGAVDAATDFSVQPVSNSLETSAIAYRLKPEGVEFKKDLSVRYSYDGLQGANQNSKLFFLVYQDKDGVYHVANKTQGNAANKTLTVSTRHFSDWSFVTRFDIKVDPSGLDGKTYLKQSQTANIIIKEYYSKVKGKDVYDQDVSELGEFPPNVTLSYTELSINPVVGILKTTNGFGKATYQAPPKITQHQTVTLIAKINGIGIGRDNEGNSIGQMQLTHDIILEPNDVTQPPTDEYFELNIDGAHYDLKNTSADYVPGWITIGGYTPGDNAFSIYLFADGPGNFGYGQVGQAGKAAMDYLLVTIDGYRHYKEKDCEKGGIDWAPGSVVLNKIAKTKGEYSEGTFSATLYSTSWCRTFKSVSATGRFKILKKV